MLPFRYNRPRSQWSWLWQAVNRTPGALGNELTFADIDPISDQPLASGLDNRYINAADSARLEAYGFHIDWQKTLGSGMHSFGVFTGTYTQNIERCVQIDQWRRPLEGVQPGDQFAVKYVRLAANDRKGMDGHQSEKQVMKFISHRNVARLRIAINFGQHRPVMDSNLNYLYNSYACMLLVMDLASYGSLYRFKYNQIFHEQQGFDTVLDGLCKGLQYLHSIGVRHGDIHDGNALIYSDTSNVVGIVAKWADFGQSITREGAIPGHCDQVADSDFAGQIRIELFKLANLFQVIIDHIEYEDIPLQVYKWQQITSQLKSVNTLDELFPN